MVARETRMIQNDMAGCICLIPCMHLCKRMNSGSSLYACKLTLKTSSSKVCVCVSVCVCKYLGTRDCQKGKWVDSICDPRGNACPAHYLCIKYPGSSPKFILTPGNPPSRPHWTANLLCKARVGGMATSPLPSQGSPIEGDQIRSGYIIPGFLGADCLVREGKNRHGWGMVQKNCPARARRANTPPKGKTMHCCAHCVHICCQNPHSICINTMSSPEHTKMLQSTMSSSLLRRQPYLPITHDTALNLLTVVVGCCNIF